MNQFDFYVVKVTSSRKTDLTRAGVSRDKVERRLAGYTRYGARSFPRWVYQASVGFFDVVADGSSKADACADEWKNKGVSSHVSYHCSD